MNKRKRVAPNTRDKRARTSAARHSQRSLTLSSECLVGNAPRLKSSLGRLLDEPQPVKLNIAALQRIDTAGLQVLAAFVQHRARNGRTVEWQGSAETLVSAAQLLGLTGLLGLPA